MSDFDKRELEYITRLESQAVDNDALRAENAKLTARIEKLERDLKRAREKKRFEAACAAMQGILADCGGTAQTRLFMDTVPTTAVEYADLLLAELEKAKEGM